MKNLHQIQVIQQALQKEREGLLAQIANINLAVSKKNEAVAKMLSYLNEYADQNKLTLSRSIPALTKNLATFSDKIQHLIKMEESEIKKLHIKRDNKFNEIEKLDQKLKVMQQFEMQRKEEIAYTKDQAEQRMIDDLSTIKEMKEKI